LTLLDLLDVIRRRWYVLAVALACALIVALFFARTDGVYTARVTLVFLPPAVMSSNESTLTSSSDSLVDFAGVVERRYNGNSSPAMFVSSAATLAGSGVRSGTRVFLPNAGGQWTYSFPDPVLVVESVSPQHDEAVETLEHTVDEVIAVAEDRQNAAGASTETRISVLVPDASVRVQYWEGSSIRAATAIGLLGLLLGGAAAVVTDHLFARRTSGRAHAHRKTHV